MIELQLYNSRTRKRETFAPIDPDHVRMYVCGPTVYDRAHVGNARPVIVFDVLHRVLRFLAPVNGWGKVTYARNITDIDDKINARASETGRSIRDITEETTGWYLEDMSALGELGPDFAPRATEYIPEMIHFINALIEKDHAYEAKRHVLFDVTSYPHYGSLSGRSLDDMIAGARVEVAPYKRDPMDFVLWKPSTDDLPGWSSPWGCGRPGWHIECSAMTRALFGESFDIHGGGADLMFPHHENEIAQSCCLSGRSSFARVWIHNEMLRVEGQKMAKSLGNFFTIRDLLDRGIPGEVIRFVFLGTHHSKPMDWTEARVREAESTLRKWRAICDDADDSGEISPTVVQALANDLNTPAALAALHDVAGKRNGSELKASAGLLGLLGDDMGDWNRPEPLSRQYDSMIGRLVQERQSARMRKDFAAADRLRDRLHAAGVELMDSAEGTVWQCGPNFDPERLRSPK